MKVEVVIRVLGEVATDFDAGQVVGNMEKFVRLAFPREDVRVVTRGTRGEDVHVEITVGGGPREGA